MSPVKRTDTVRPRHALATLSLILLLTAGDPLRSQQTPTFSSNVKVVNVPATVRNKKGEIVRDLTKDDFSLTEDDRPQTIHYFAKENDLPLTLGLLVDTSGSQRRVLDDERSASYTFLDQMMRMQDQAFIIHFEGEVELLQDLTNSRQKLESALNQVAMPQMDQRGGGGGGGGGSSPGSWPGPGGRGGRGGGGRGMRGGGTALYDAVFLASDELMTKQKGRKALIILSDGVDNASKVTLERAIESAQRADTLVYSILFADEDAYGRGGFSGGWGGGMGGRGGMGRRGGGGSPFPQQQEHPDGKKTLKRISQETGARMFEVSKKHPITEIYAQIQEELRNQYNLGYTPDRAAADDGGYHRIHVALKEKDLIVQAREGYYAEQ